MVSRNEIMIPTYWSQSHLILSTVVEICNHSNFSCCFTCNWSSYSTFRLFLQPVRPKTLTTSIQILVFPKTSIHQQIHLLQVQTAINRRVLVNQRRRRIHWEIEHALFVVKCSLDRIFSLFTWEYILEKNHMHALSVKNDSTRKAVWTDIFSLTLERNHIRVNTAATHVHWNHILPCI